MDLAHSPRSAFPRALRSVRRLLTAGAFATASLLPAQITSSIDIGFGEGLDSGVAGQPLHDTAYTSLEGFSLDLLGSGGTYTASVPSGTGSTLAAHFGGATSFVSFPLEIDGTASFGLQFWVRPDDTLLSGGVAFNGHTDTTGVGILQSNDHFVLALGGVATADADTIFLPDNWNHLALVYQAETHTTSLYQNGVVVASVSDAFIPVGTSDNDDGDFSFGAAYTSALAPSYFSGSIDSAQFFQFDGTFDPDTMLTYPPSAVPEPATFALLAGLAALGAIQLRRRLRRA